MARPLRIELAGGLYHVTSRGDRREGIYRDDDDRRAWLEVFGAVRERFNWRCHAYCLMSNHYHVVVETPEANLSKGMRQLNGVFTQVFNRRHGLVGHQKIRGQVLKYDTHHLTSCDSDRRSRLNYRRITNEPDNAEACPPPLSER